MERASAFWVPAGELEENDRELVARIRKPTVVPVDHAQPTVRRDPEVVCPKVAVAGPERAGRRHQRLHRDELVAVRAEGLREGRAGAAEVLHQGVPAVRADRLGVPRIRGTAPSERDGVQRSDERPDPRRIGIRVGLAEVDPAEEPDLLPGDRNDERSVGRQEHLRSGNADRPGGLLEGGVLSVPLLEEPEGLFHGEASPRRRQLPDLAELPARGRPG